MQQQQYDTTVTLKSVFTARFYYPIFIKQQDVRLVHDDLKGSKKPIPHKKVSHHRIG
ncbi:hypothetical protein KAM474_26380 [Aeromonas caviae]|nr:hypothetical protein KAM474_26380 [Aeromonas caviae]